MLSVILAATIFQKSFIPEPSQVVVYEANLRALGPKVGFNALARRLDSIKALGVNVLWIMPVNPVGKLRSAGGLGSPYSVSDFDAINPEFGTEGDFRSLVQDAHKRNIAVLIDWVPNHTAWDHPWIKRNPDWYTKDKNGNISIPEGTNWQDVADLDYTKPELRKAMIDAMRGWIQRYDIDGFRVDTADFVPFQFWKEAVPKIRASAKKPLFMLAEGFRSDHYAAGFDITFGWPFFDGLRQAYAGKSAKTIAEHVSRELKDIPKGSRRLRFTTNHDKAAWEGTTREFFKSDAGARGAFVATALYGGTPLIYTGQEANWQSRIPIFDHSSIDWSNSKVEGKWLGDIIRLRSSRPALRDGIATDFSSDDVILFLKSKGSDRALVAVNVRGRSISLAIPAALMGDWKDGFTKAPSRLGARLNLPAYGYRVWVK